MSSTKTKKPLVPQNIESLVPYPPGKPIEELERELGITGSIKLASNENPLGPSPRAVAAMQKVLANLHRYPDGSGYYLRQKLAQKYGYPEEWFVLGTGSNEIIELLLRTFLGRDEEVLTSRTSFAVYAIITQACGGRITEVPMTDDLRFDLPAIAAQINERTKLIFLTNPNNPTGTYYTKAEFEAFLAHVPADCLVAIDEAYFEFVDADDYPNGLDYLRERPNLIVMRTFSKIYGLAGVRLGFGIAHPEVVGYMNRVRQPFNVNMLAQVAGIAALEDDDFVRHAQETNRKGLSYLYAELDKLGLSYVRTVTNFFLIKGPVPGRKIYDALLREGVIVRPLENYGLPQYFRINVGTMEENVRFITTLAKVLPTLT
jgi:histidinol-phosphate aminotransferase